jgi:hypothetical protein
MAEAARWLEWQGRDAVVRTASVALAAGATTATAGAFLHAVFAPGANRWLRVPKVTTVHFLSMRMQKRASAPAQPLAPVIAVARRLMALTATLRPEPHPLEELHGPAAQVFNADALVEGALAVPGLRLRVLRLGRTHALSPRVAIAALRSWGPTSLTEWHADVRVAQEGPEMQHLLRALAGCTMLRVLRCDGIRYWTLPLLPSLRVLTAFRPGSFKLAGGTAGVDALATSCPALECLCVGPERPAAPVEFATLFARIPSLTQISWCYPEQTHWRQDEIKPVPERVPAPQARRVAFSWDMSAEPYAELYPNVSELYFVRRQPCSPTAIAVLSALTQLRILVITPDTNRTVGRRRFDREPEYIPTDAQTAQLLASLPLLEHLDVSVYNGRNPYLTFASADFAGIVAPRLRTLKMAAAWRLRGRGLRNVALVCPNLRHLDVRAAFAMSRREFIDALVEFSAADVRNPRCTNEATAGAAAANSHAKAASHLEQRLRLPKLRRLYSTFRRRLPKALNFNTYCSGCFELRCDAGGRPLEPRDVELQPLLEPEHVMVYATPRHNKRRSLVLPKRGVDMQIRIEETLSPGDFPTPRALPDSY